MAIIKYRKENKFLIRKRKEPKKRNVLLTYDVEF